MLANLTTTEALISVTAIAQQVFFSMAGIEVSPADRTARKEEMPIAAVLTYSRVIEADILMECSRALAYLFTSRLMNIPLPASCDSDVADSISELVNMIGGNLKGLMPPQTNISCPHMPSPSELRQIRDSSDCLGSVYLQAGSDPLCISLLEHKRQVAPA